MPKFTAIVQFPYIVYHEQTVEVEAANMVEARVLAIRAADRDWTGARASHRLTGQTSIREIAPSAPVLPGEPIADTEEMRAYKEALRRHDWTYQYSDDHRYWAAGQASWDHIQAMAKRLDPDFRVMREVQDALNGQTQA